MLIEVDDKTNFLIVLLLRYQILLSAELFRKPKRAAKLA